MSAENISTLRFNSSISMTLYNNCTILQGRQSFTLNGTPLILSGAICLLQAFNLVVFSRWPNKQPFLMYHVSLAACAVSFAIFGSPAPIARLLPWSRVSEVVAIISAYTSIVIGRIGQLNILAISLDRLLSVEFPIPYRDHITRTKVSVVLGVNVLVALLLVVPAAAVPANIVVSCNRPILAVNKPYYYVMVVITAVMICSQCRILVIAVETKLRLLQPRLSRVQPAQPPEDHRRATRRTTVVVVRIVRENLLAASIVVIVAIVAAAGRILDGFGMISKSSSAIWLQFSNMMETIQYLATPFVYLAFYRPFRVAARTLLPSGMNARQHPVVGRRATFPAVAAEAGLADAH
ncbi:hypothetical protein BV898_03492 [Hypsibius exemplaris]|uniref:G-protein coupled receptors family 1 profile domain-containing protein n=1 Tax=Hypsibius exemplaris TaxID=2072580 RepID=A0A1W0X523_HYPEX|nr:hypothetical protein BV898_03492 [Hypsibius exemplaris]